VDGRDLGAQELVIAVFRLAVADYLGITYGHDCPNRKRRKQGGNEADAATFLASPWAVYLGDMVGIPAPVIWSEAIRLKRGIAFPRLAALTDPRVGFAAARRQGERAQARSAPRTEADLGVAPDLIDCGERSR
jgi:hypothetical protein